MWFEPLAEVGTLLAGCAAMLGVAMPFFKKSSDYSNCVVSVHKADRRLK
ncbi:MULTISPECIES: hypothetical protein [unclassified Leisingera]|nr:MULTISPECIES: hypothetical protein [unclassified Leisingera]MBQ4823747.1 hypothetical protein [Leisingera sp. HS039]